MSNSRTDFDDGGGVLGAKSGKVGVRGLLASGLKPPPPPQFSPAEIREIRESANVSQAVFAVLLGTTTGTVTQWEQGLRNPSGPALKLLDLVKRRGMTILF